MHNYMSNYMFNRPLTAINGEPKISTENAIRYALMAF